MVCNGDAGRSLFVIVGSPDGGAVRSLSGGSAGRPKEGARPSEMDFGEVQRYYSLDTNTVSNC